MKATNAACCVPVGDHVGVLGALFIGTPASPFYWMNATPALVGSLSSARTLDGNPFGEEPKKNRCRCFDKTNPNSGRWPSSGISQRRIINDRGGGRGVRLKKAFKKNLIADERATGCSIGRCVLDLLASSGSVKFPSPEQRRQLRDLLRQPRMLIKKIE
jgi:hypothetical protein